MNADGTNKKAVYKALKGSAFAPSWSPDGQSMVFGFGSFLQGRRTGGAKIMMMRRDGTEVQDDLPLLVSRRQPDRAYPRPG